MGISITRYARDLRYFKSAFQYARKEGLPQNLWAFLRCREKDILFITHPGLRPPLQGGERRELDE